jgi:hypothetical protein
VLECGGVGWKVFASGVLRWTSTMMGSFVIGCLACP